jgi:hypothetical protein
MIAPRCLIEGMTSVARFGLTSRSCENGFVRTAALFRSGRTMKTVHGCEIGMQRTRIFGFFDHRVKSPIVFSFMVDDAGADACRIPGRSRPVRIVMERDAI